MMDFQQWLDLRGIDIQSIESEMQITLVAQYELEQSPQETGAMKGEKGSQEALLPFTKPTIAAYRKIAATDVLVLPVDCAWPQRGHWIAVGQ